MHSPLLRLYTTLLVSALVSGCSAARTAPAVQAAPLPARAPVNDADVHFMSGMIQHHEQAVIIGRWAVTHGASDAVRRLSERIVVAQQDEIALMRTWLADRGAHGMDHAMMMPGMLTPQQLAQLDSARGREFDKLFLTFMIQHHYGAVAMVEKLFGSYGAAQDETVFRFASDVFADQTTEIDRMQSMLANLEGQP